MTDFLLLVLLVSFGAGWLIATVVCQLVIRRLDRNRR